MTASLSTPSPTRREKELDMPPTFYPAVDLKDGKCVQLAPGVTDQPIRVCGRPSNASARIWQDTRFAWLQRGGPEWRFDGRPANASAIKAILQTIHTSVLFAGGIRDTAGIEAWLTSGVRRVIPGSAAAKPRRWYWRLPRLPARITVGTDARDGQIATEGWRETSSVVAHELALRFEDAGVAAIIYTDISRDGMLGGVNAAQTVELARLLITPVIASGGGEFRNLFHYGEPLSEALGGRHRRPRPGKPAGSSPPRRGL